MKMSAKMAALALAIATTLPAAADAASNNGSTFFNNVGVVKNKPVPPAGGKQVGTSFKDGHVTGVFAPNGKPIFFYSDKGVVVAPNPYTPPPPPLPPDVARQHVNSHAGVPAASYTMSPR